MADVRPSGKSCSVDPLKTSAPLGAALAFLGIEGAVPLFHGAQGCTSFALVLAVRHFKEAIPLQTTAMNEVSTILGGREHLEEALVNVAGRMKPALIGVATTALVETRGEDFAGDLAAIRARRPELAGTKIVLCGTPEYTGALEDGWARATTAVIDALVLPPGGASPDEPQINVLPGVHQTAGDLEELGDIVAAFGLEARFLPDVSGSLDGHVPDGYIGTSLGGIPVGEIACLGRARHTIAIGEHMRAPAAALEARTGVATTLFPTLVGLEPNDRLIALLAALSGRPVPARLRRRRSQLLDAMLDGHFHFSGKRVAIGADPDLLHALSHFYAGLGAEVVAAVASTTSPALERVACDSVVVGDLADLEELAGGADLLVSHSHGRQAAARLGIPLHRVGFPIFDRLGVANRRNVGYAGTRELIFEVANLLAHEGHATRPIVEDTRRAQASAH